VAAYRRALEQGRNADLIRYALASLGAEAAPAIAPRQVVVALFDDYAERFDDHVVGTLKYRVPDLLFDAVARFVPPRALDVLDVGCGTGLAGARFRPLARALTG